jgi:hypothetical protein
MAYHAPWVNLWGNLDPPLPNEKPAHNRTARGLRATMYVDREQLPIGLSPGLADLTSQG